MQEAPATPQEAPAAESFSLDDTLSNLVGKLEGWVEAIILKLPNLLAALLIVLAAILVARLVRRGVRKLMDRVSSYHAVNGLLSTIAYVLVLSIGVFVALGALGLDKTVTALLGGAGVIGLAIGFASQDIAANFISGILLSVRRPFREGDIIETNGFFGTINEINLRATHLRTFPGQIIIIPNKDVFQNPIQNYSRLGKRRVDLACGVAYGDDLEKAERVAVEALSAIDYRDKSRDVDLYYNEFGDSSINFVIRFWIDFRAQTDFLRAQSDAIKRLKKAFDENGITIPFPIRTLDFGVVGGVNLNEVLPERLYESNGNTSNKQASSSP